MLRCGRQVILGVVVLLAARAGDVRSAPIDAEGVSQAMWAAARWQIANPQKFRPVEWEIAPLYDGLLAAGTATGKAAYVGEVLRMGEANRFGLARRLYHADDHAVGHAWLDLYLADRTHAERMTPTREQLDRVLANPELRPLEMGKPGPEGDRWTWCDALYMGPPTWSRLFVATGDRKYLDFLDREWRYTYDMLWDADEHLFYRDSRFKVQRSANGKKVFWSRGNGWVVGGLALMLPDLPADHPSRPLYETTFKQMAAALIKLQRPDGLWSPSLLDDKDPDAGETSGSAFFIYGMAWGVNHGLLDRETYWPVIERGWAALLTRQLPSGQIGYVQQVGDRPDNTKREDHHTYGTGAFLLAGSEIYRTLKPDAARPLAAMMTEAEAYAAVAQPATLPTSIPITAPVTQPSSSESLRPAQPVSDVHVLEPNAGWCWFQDERAIVVNGNTLVLGTVAGTTDAVSRGGDIKVTAVNLTGGQITHATLHPALQQDDHNAPALIELSDGRILAAYSKHSSDDQTRFRITNRPGDITSWSEEATVRHPDTVCYNNLFAVPRDGQPSLVNFTRAVGFNPNVMLSVDDGRNWSSLGQLLAWPDRPYLRYAADGAGAIHFIATDGHPRVFDNNLYHGIVRGNTVYDAAGAEAGVLGGSGIAEKSKLTTIFRGDPQNVAWPVDVQAYPDGSIVLLFSVQKDGASIKNEPNAGRCWDHRYHLARFDGRTWTQSEIAFAGSGLYAAEPDYTGLGALDPNDPTTLVISADVDPTTSLPNVSKADGRRHYELFRGQTSDGGKTWTWSPLTRDSTADNLRPVIPADAKRRIILWTRGSLRTYTDYSLDLVGRFETR